MKRAIRAHLFDFVAIIALFVVAIAVGGYILSNQRVRFPIIQKATFELKAEFSTSQAVIPGQGQTVRVSGVRIGDIAKTELKNGRAIVTMAIDPEFADLVHRDATALLRPKTGLKDMFVDLEVGSDSAPRVEAGETIPIASTLPDINPDEVLSALDADTRDYLKLLISDAGKGLKGRGNDLKDVYRRFEPTHRDLARITENIALRRNNLRRLIRSLNVLNGELATKDTELATLIDASATVFRAFASEEQNITSAVSELPGALGETTRALQNVDSFAEILKPAADNLRPAVRKLDRANKAAEPFFRATAPHLRDSIRPFVRGAAPIVRDVRAPARTLERATPDLGRSFTVLNRLFNMLGYNHEGAEDANVPERMEGYLFYIAWVSHQALNLFGSSDAHGTFRPVTLGFPCQVVHQIVNEEPELAALINLSQLVTGSGLCVQGGEGESLIRRSMAAAKAEGKRDAQATTEAGAKARSVAQSLLERFAKAEGR